MICLSWEKCKLYKRQGFFVTSYCYSALVSAEYSSLLEKQTATHSSVLAWRIPGTGEPGGLPSMGSHRVGHDWSDLAAIYWYTKHYVTCHLVLINLYFNLQAYKLGTIHLIFQIRKLLDKSHNFPSCLTITQVCLTVKSNRWVLVLVSWTKQSTSAKWI